MAELKPFPVRTTEAIERANRFLALKGHPAFNDLLQVSRQLVEEARLNQRNFMGWDTQQIVTLAIRVQVAEQYHEQFFGRIEAAIAEGVTEAKAALDQRATIEESDQLRSAVLSRQDDMRIPGSH